MTTSPESEIVPMPGFDPLVFWLQHKSKIIIYAILLVVAAVGFAAYEIMSQQRLAESQRLYAQAATEDDYRNIVQKFPHTIAAGNATLMLAEKLRDSKKYDEAVVLLQTMIDQYPDYPLIDTAWLALAATFQAAGKTDEALVKYQLTATKFPTTSSAPHALVAEAGILKDQGKLDDARHAYENVKSQFPNSYYAALAMQELQQLKK